MNKWSRLLLAVTFALSAANSRAGVVIGLVSSDATISIPGTGTTQFTIDGSIAADTGDQQILSYNLTLDIRRAGDSIAPGLPTGWSFTTAALDPLPNFSGIGFQTPASDPNPGVDLHAFDSSVLPAAVPATLTTAPVNLFRMTVTISDQAQAGDYIIDVIDHNLLSVVDQNFNDLPDDQINIDGARANVRLLAVPEPSSMGLILAGICGCALARRRRS